MTARIWQHVPPKPNARTQVQTSCTYAEKEIITKAAQELGISVSEFIRQAINGKLCGEVIKQGKCQPNQYSKRGAEND